MGLYKIKAQQYWQKGITGKGVNISIIDYGIEEHEYIRVKGRVSFGKNKKIIATRPASSRLIGLAYDSNLYDKYI